MSPIGPARSLVLRACNFQTARFTSQSVNVKNNSFAMSGCGGLMPFHVGVIKAMKERGVMNDTSHYAGTSGGSICSLLACSNLPCEEALELIIQVSTDPVIWSNMDAGIRKTLDILITEEKLQLCQGRLHIATTRVWPKPKAQVTMFSNFDSKEHLIDCVAASCFIPLYGARNQFKVKIGGANAVDSYLDGGVFAFMPPVGDVTISPFANNHFHFKPPNWRDIDIHLDKRDYPLSKLLYWALHPAPEKELRELSRQGEIKAHKWMDERKL